MPQFSYEVPHSLDRDEAITRLKDFTAKVEKAYKDQVSDMAGEWNDNQLTFSFSSFGFAISGELTVEDSKAVVQGKLPFAAAMFRGKIESSIAAELGKALK